MRQTLTAGTANVASDTGRTWTKIQTRPRAIQVNEHSAPWSEIMDGNPEYLAAAKEILEEDAEVAADGSTPDIVENAAARCSHTARSATSELTVAETLADGEIAPKIVISHGGLIGHMWQRFQTHPYC